METTTAPGGTTAVTVTGSDGSVSERTVTVSAADAASGSTVTLPLALSAANGPSLTITVPEGAGAVVVEIPVSAANSGTVAVIVHEDGTEEIVMGTVQTESGVRIRVQGSVTVKIIDRSVEFDDTRDDWARDAMLWASQNGILIGMDGNLLAPGASAECAQVAAIFARFLRLMA